MCIQLTIQIVFQIMAFHLGITSVDLDRMPEPKTLARILASNYNRLFVSHTDL